jgi:hypothetical protein
MPKAPYIGFSAATMAKQPLIAAGDFVDCPHCGSLHEVVDAEPPGHLLFYRCGPTAYLAGLGGRCVVGLRADVSGATEY